MFAISTASHHIHLPIWKRFSTGNVDRGGVKKGKKANSRARGVINSSRRGDVIQLLFAS